MHGQILLGEVVRGGQQVRQHAPAATIRIKIKIQRVTKLTTLCDVLLKKNKLTK